MQMCLLLYKADLIRRYNHRTFRGRGIIKVIGNLFLLLFTVSTSIAIRNKKNKKKNTTISTVTHPNHPGCH